jgi:hypothetical protein
VLKGGADLLVRPSIHPIAPIAPITRTALTASTASTALAVPMAPMAPMTHRCQVDMSTLKPLLKSMKDDISSMVENNIGSMKNDISNMKNDISNMVSILVDKKLQEFINHPRFHSRDNKQNLGQEKMHNQGEEEDEEGENEEEEEKIEASNVSNTPNETKSRGQRLDSFLNKLIDQLELLPVKLRLDVTKFHEEVVKSFQVKFKGKTPSYVRQKLKDLKEKLETVNKEVGKKVFPFFNDDKAYRAVVKVCKPRKKRKPSPKQRSTKRADTPILESVPERNKHRHKRTHRETESPVKSTFISSNGEASDD